MGETGRSAWERGNDHLKAWREKEEGSFLWKHHFNEHGEDGMGEGDIKMEVIGKPRKALQRQVEEAVRIGEEKPGELMNSKKEYGHNKIPRIRIAMGDEIRGRRDDWERERNRREEKAQREEKQRRDKEDMVWGSGEECIWEIQRERDAWEQWRGEKRGAARTRGRTEEDKPKSGWWGWKREEGGQGGRGDRVGVWRGERWSWRQT